MPTASLPARLQRIANNALRDDQRIDIAEAQELVDKASTPAARAALDSFAQASSEVFTPEAQRLLGLTLNPLSPSSGPSSGGVASSVDIVPFPGEPLDSKGETRQLEIVVPPDAVSFSIIARGADGDSLLVSLVDPPGSRNLVESDPPSIRVDRANNPFDAGQLVSPNRTNMGGITGQAEALVPNNPGVKLEPGRYRLQIKGFAPPTATADFNGPASAPVDVTVAIKRVQGGEPKRGRLGIRMFFSGADGYRAGSVTESPVLKRALDMVREKLASWGLELAIGDSVDLPPGQTSPGSENELKALVARGTTDELGLFFVNRIFGDPAIGGFSTGTPGPSPGQGPGGILIATDGIPSNFPAVEPGATALAVHILHEIGHYLGLYHSVDPAFGNLEDQLPDTPTDYDNVMAQATQAAGGYSLELTPQQVAVMLRHPRVVITEVERAPSKPV